METRVRTVEKKGLNALDLALVAVLLAVGAVLRIANPIKVGGITPNLIIGMYCLAILLIRPRFLPLLGISLVAAAICQVTSASLFPYLNFASEPVGVLAAGLLALIPFENGILKYVRPFVVTLFGTLASGFAYILIFQAMVISTGTKGPAFTYLVYVVLVTALVNSVLASILYFPLKAALGRTR